MEFIRVPRHRENLPGQLEAIDHVLDGSEWRRIGYYPAPSRDIALQRLPGRGRPFISELSLLLELGMVAGSAQPEVYGGLGYLINADDELD